MADAQNLDSDEDNGTVEAAIVPSFIALIRKILNDYRDGGQILKELLQNAEDAKASEVNILADSRCFSPVQDASSNQRRRIFVQVLRGPALCVYNNGQFTDKDWEGIKMLHQSVKEKDQLKVGRFGLGFKSVFHMTDRLMVMSDKSILYMDPFKGIDEYCMKYEIEGLRGVHLKSILRCLDGVFGIKEELFHAGSGGFPGTLFWFPLRQAESELSSTIYSADKVDSLLAAFRSEASSMLLFLNNIESVGLYTRSEDVEPALPVFSVSLDAACLANVRQERRRFLEAIQNKEEGEIGEGLPQQNCRCVVKISIRVNYHDIADEVATHPETTTGKETLHSVGVQKGDVQNWQVVSYHAGTNNMSHDLKRLCADTNLSYRPYVGVAAPLGQQDQPFQSQLFCFLPLPLDTRSPTGLPVHVNGFFSLSSDRRQVNWPTADQIQNRTKLASAEQWNCLLVEELVPEAYKILLHSLRNMDDPKPQELYSALPDVNLVEDKWKSLLRPLYLHLTEEPSFYSNTDQGSWVKLQDAVVEHFKDPSLQTLFDNDNDISSAITKVYQITGHKLVRLPAHIYTTLEKLDLLHCVETMTAERISQLLPLCMTHLMVEDRLSLLTFFCSHSHRLRLLLNLELLPLSDWTFTKFQQKNEHSVFLCQDELKDLFIGLENRFCRNDLRQVVKECLDEMANSGYDSLQILKRNDPQIPQLLQQSIEARYRHDQPILPTDSSWIQNVWEVLLSSWDNLSSFLHLPLLPELRDDKIILLPLNGVYVCKAVDIEGMVPLTSHMETCLTKLQVHVLPKLPGYVQKHPFVLGHLIHYPSWESVKNAILEVDKNIYSRRCAVDTFNSTASEEEKIQIISLIETCPEGLPVMFEELMLFTEVKSQVSVAVKDVSRIAPEILPPLLPHQRLLEFTSVSHRKSAQILGAVQVTLQDITLEILDIIKNRYGQFNEQDIINFAQFVLDSTELNNCLSVLEKLKTIKFVPAQGGQLKLPQDLYDPSSTLLQQLFLAEDKFPENTFSSQLATLKRLGIRGEQEIKMNDLLETSYCIQSMLETNEVTCAVQKAEALMEILIRYEEKLDIEILKKLPNIKFMPCLQDRERLHWYPQSLPVSSQEALVRPKDMCLFSQALIAGSVCPIMKESVPESLAKKLYAGHQIDTCQVLQHLENIIKYYNGHDSLYALKEVLGFLQSHMSDSQVAEKISQMACIPSEQRDRLLKPSTVWIKPADTDIQLKPYRFYLHAEFQSMNRLFLASGAAQQQTPQMLETVLSEIEVFHRQISATQLEIDQLEIDRDMRMVKQILDVLKRTGLFTDKNIFLPICNSNSDSLVMKPAKMCTVMSQDAFITTATFSGDEEIYIVHTDISEETAVHFGALKLRDRALTGLEDLDFGYKQTEELTERLKVLLEESYTDGFSVPKEIIQNADDAKATEVSFLLDERENKDATQNLISEEMSSLQGPALWAYNNATFTDVDFENIVKLGAGTKRRDTTKVGKFGLGFNSVYNLTDVPSFISRHVMAFFDPHMKYLKKGAGLRLDFKNPVNIALLTRMAQQFKPYQGIFGCNLNTNESINFNGTLFRLPFRTEQQASSSKIKNESYSWSKRREFLKLLLSGAGNLLLFTQFVNKIKVLHLPPGSENPSSAVCLLEVSKTSQRQVLVPQIPLQNCSIMKYYTDHWNAKNDIQIIETADLKVTVTDDACSVCSMTAHESTTRWCLAWASGVKECAQLVRQHPEESLLPLAVTAALVGVNDHCKIYSLSESPEAFYKSGHFFCCLPLPDSMIAEKMKVHVNATFALTSSRRGLLVSSEDDLRNSIRSEWNCALMSDAVSRAYLLLLKSLQTMKDFDATLYFSLFPSSGSNELGKHFYKQLIKSQQQLLPVPMKKQWTSVQEALCLEIRFRYASGIVGQNAWNMLASFNKTDKNVVDVPEPIYHLIMEYGDISFVTVENFFRDIFFPNISHCFIDITTRNQLTLFAITNYKNNKIIAELLEHNACIPCTSPENLYFEVQSIAPESTNEIKCKTTLPRKLKQPNDLYNPDSYLLKRLFSGEEMFPADEFLHPHVTENLKAFGLRTEEHVSSNDLVHTAKCIEQNISVCSADMLAAEQKCEGLWDYFHKHGARVDTKTLQIISEFMCMPCLKQKDRPEQYPSAVPFGVGETYVLAKAKHMCHYFEASIIGSVLPVLRDGLPQCVTDGLGIGQQVEVENVVKHLDNVIQYYCKNELTKYKAILVDIFSFLSGHETEAVKYLKSRLCILTDSGEQFCKPCDFWIERNGLDIDLKPYMQPLPQEFIGAKKLFLSCGAILNQNHQMLEMVLFEIEKCHQQGVSSQSDYNRDLQVVKNVLEILSTTSYGTDIILPIDNGESTTLKFQPAKKCTVLSGEIPLMAFEAVDDLEEIYLVHREINQSTATRLGALRIKDRALTGAVAIDFGQHEVLTDRIHGLLKDSYTDGLSVPKELIQNADDANATEVCFILDERQFVEANKSLIDDAMESLQGPALWAYNNAHFTDKDLANITKLGSGTKKDDTNKIGRFGLGFNAVYNITDVPSFLSREHLAFFDPHESYLGKRGIKFDFSNPVNRALLSRLPDQFKPYQGIFSCCLKSTEKVFFDGTLFRLPFRTKKQAEVGKLKNDSYSEEKRRDLIRLFLSRAGSLLLFTQNVKTLKLFYLPPDSSNPSNPQCILNITKESLFFLEKIEKPLENQTVLQYFTQQWSDQLDTNIVEKVNISMYVTAAAQMLCKIKPYSTTTKWKIGWTSGTGTSAKIANIHKKDRLLPLAAVAALVNDGKVCPLSESPEGFFKSGHLFCFLPLPDTAVYGQLPVHINATFSLTSSRRNLMSSSEDDLQSEGAEWNNALMGDAVSRAYLLLLENLQHEATQNISSFFQLWPVNSETFLLNGFWDHFVTDKRLVLPLFEIDRGVTGWTNFIQSWFLDPEFHCLEIGEIAWKYLQHFWMRDGYLIKIPFEICSSLMSVKCVDFQSRVISEQLFFTECLFPKINDSFWNAFDRDRLVYCALLQNDDQIRSNIETNACIPCTESQRLRRPCELIHPQRHAAAMYCPRDGLFPQRTSSVIAVEINLVDFCSNQSLERLEKLGMITDDLPPNMILERAASCKSILEKDKSSAFQRVKSIFEYLCSYSYNSPVSRLISYVSGSLRINDYAPDVIDQLSHISFFPVLQTPEYKKWPFPWATDTDYHDNVLASPCELYEGSLKDIVACHKKVLDNDALGLMVHKKNAFAVLHCLKVHIYNPKDNLITNYTNVCNEIIGEIQSKNNSDNLMNIAILQLLTITETARQVKDISTSILFSVSCNIYHFLSECMKRSEQCKNGFEYLKNKDVIWTGSCFVDPSRVAFKVNHDCRPYLYRVDSSMLIFKELFEVLGVCNSFSPAKLVSVLEDIRKTNEGEPISDEELGYTCRLAEMLSESLSHCEEPRDIPFLVFLPDRQCLMQPVSKLCIDDCDWLKETDSMKFVHGKVAPETAKVLGVKSKRKHDYDTMGISIPFGQKEKLTNRIKGLLQGYTFDSSLFKELLQNADDAGATEIRFIKDFRYLRNKYVLEGFEKLQGPALCVFNDKSFTNRDMEGIQNLGEGSKGQEVLKIGRYGVGFNSVYHITDVPSFWTLEDDITEAVCFFDPNCHYLSQSTLENPGIKFTNVKRLQEAYPDTFSGYLGNHFDMSKPGTLFRFPLRTKAMAEVSEIKKIEVTPEEVTQFLDEFRNEMSKCLLFLNNLRKIGIYSVTEDGKLSLEHDVSLHYDNNNFQKMEAFKQHLDKSADDILDISFNLKSVRNIEECVELKICSNKDIEEWICVHRVGIKDVSYMSEELENEWHKDNFRRLPRGGVAVLMSKTMNGKETTTPYPLCNSQAFCVLPLPIQTGLPVHVNGHFALDHETRRGLWENKENKSDIRTEWNNLLAVQVIVPSYLSLLQLVKVKLFSSVTEMSHITVHNRLHFYHCLFPDLKSPAEFWTQLKKHLYLQIARHVLPLFPVLYQEQKCVIDWVPAVLPNGIPGYFNNLEKLFSDVPDIPPSHKSVVLSQGSIQGQRVRKDNTEWIQKRAAELKDILKSVNLKILEAPFSLHDNFINSGVADVKHLTPETVFDFLKTVDRDIIGRCNLEGLPQNLAATSLKNPSNVKCLLQFISYRQALFENLEGLPLSLRESGTLCIFQEQQMKPILSKSYFDLLFGSSDNFIHRSIVIYFYQNFKLCYRWVSKFEIHILIDLLPKTLSEKEFKTGHPCLLDESQFPIKKWITRLWLFISSKCKNVISVDTLRQEFENDFHGLLQWNLLPVRHLSDRQEELLLYPLGDIHKVIYLPEKPELSNQTLWTCLKELGLPVLNTMLLPANHFLQDIVASISHPWALLKALFNFADHMRPNAFQSSAILNYFANNIGILRHFCDNENELKLKLKSLPMFCKIDGQLTFISTNTRTLCLSAEIPHDGLVQWGTGAGYILLKSNNMPEALSELLKFEFPSIPNFYSFFLLPLFVFLPFDAIVHQMHFIKVHLNIWKTNEQDDVIDVLRKTSFIEKHGKLSPACAFYSKCHPVFFVMCQPDDFPQEPYCAPDWKSFMKKAGMICDVSEAMYIQFAKSLEHSASISLTSDTQNKCKVLLKYLYNSQPLTVNFLEHLKTIRFILPSEWANSFHGQILTNIAQPYKNYHLVSAADSCSEDKLFLVWSNTSIRHKSTDFERYSGYSEGRSDLLVRHFLNENSVSKHAVLEHFLTLALSLGQKENLLQSNDVYTIILSVMLQIYNYMQENLDANDFRHLRNKDVALIYCHESKPRAMLRAENVVINLREEEVIAGQIEKASSRFSSVYRLFKELGVAERVTADHYARTLANLKTMVKDSRLHVEELKLKVKIAVRELFNCLRSEIADIRQLTVPQLFLPSESFHLVKSTQLVFFDHVRFRHRINRMPQDIQFILSFNALGLAQRNTQTEIELLPEHYRVQIMSNLVREVIPENIKREASTGNCSRQLQQLLQDPLVVQLIIRLSSHYHFTKEKQFTQEKIQQLRKNLENITILESAHLKTVLMWIGSELEGTSEMKVAFAEHNKIDGVQKCIVYLDKVLCTPDKIRGLQVSKCISYAVKCVTGLKNSFNEYLNLIFQNPAEALVQMDCDGIQFCDFQLTSEETVFPPAGTFIPPDLHCYLDNTFASFYDGEHVGFEVYDPQVDETGASEDNDPIYIYAIVLQEITEDGVKEIPLILKRYRIDLGSERGEETVPVTKLYKFVRKPSVPSSTPDAVVQYQGRTESNTSSSKPKTPMPLDFRQVMGEIKAALTDAWRSLDEKERNRVVKRLYLRWHPDKNRGNEELCTRVVQRLQQYVQMLKDGKQIPDESDDEDTMRSSRAQPQWPFSPDVSSFFENMNRRSRSYREHFGSQSRSADSSSDSTDSGSRRDYSGYNNDYSSYHFRNFSEGRANPQPGEGRRWFRQAQADIDSAQDARSSCRRGFNWMCFQCHQGVEKALKAVLYYRDANSSLLREHSLNSLASAVGEPTLISIASQLEFRVGNHMRMRYPDLLCFPKIPADVYTTDDVSFAVDCATRVLEKVQRLLSE